MSAELGKGCFLAGALAVVGATAGEPALGGRPLFPPSEVSAAIFMSFRLVEPIAGSELSVRPAGASAILAGLTLFAGVSGVVGSDVELLEDVEIFVGELAEFAELDGTEDEVGPPLLVGAALPWMLIFSNPLFRSVAGFDAAIPPLPVVGVFIETADLDSWGELTRLTPEPPILGLIAGCALSPWDCRLFRLCPD